jgi:hypothetical protein
MADELDGERIAQLAHPMMELIRANYLRGPLSRDRVFEALNALAFCAAVAIAGTGDRQSRREARAFLDDAITEQTRDLVLNPPGGPLQ